MHHMTWTTASGMREPSSVYFNLNIHLHVPSCRKQLSYHFYASDMELSNGSISHLDGKKSMTCNEVIGYASCSLFFYVQ